MDQQSQSRRSDASVIQTLLERVRQLENLASHNFGVITNAIPPNERKFLTEQTSPSVVKISCWKRYEYLVGKERLEAARGIRSTSYATGFVIDSNTSSTLILTCAHFVLPFFKTATKTDMKTIQKEGMIWVKFYDDDDKGGESELVYVDFSHDLALLRVRGVARKVCLRFFEEEDELEGCLTGLPIYTISHPLVHKVIHPYCFTQGKICGRCTPVPEDLLASDCHCLMYTIPADMGSSGAPILSANGKVVAVHSSYSSAFHFGIGLTTIKKALMNFFNLHSVNHEDLSTNRVLDLGSGRY